MPGTLEVLADVDHAQLVRQPVLPERRLRFVEIDLPTKRPAYHHSRDLGISGPKL